MSLCILFHCFIVLASKNTYPSEFVATVTKSFVVGDMHCKQGRILPLVDRVVAAHGASMCMTSPASTPISLLSGFFLTVSKR